MKSLRSKIIKIGILNLLCLGLLAAIAKPIDGSASGQNFTNWLQVLVKKTHNQEAKQQIRKLQSSGSDMSQLVSQASKIVSEHASDFDLPASKSSGAIQQLLLVEWNQYQAGNTMLAVPVLSMVKSLISHQYVVNVMSSAADCLIFENTGQGASQFVIIDVFRSCARWTLQPLVNGIAIGAP